MPFIVVPGVGVSAMSQPRESRTKNQMKFIERASDHHRLGHAPRKNVRAPVLGAKQPLAVALALQGPIDDFGFTNLMGKRK
jgi:hypothetical protein